jgi:hypothetical protein
LDLRKGRSHFIERPDDQIRECNVRQLLLALGGPSLESPDTPFLGAPDTLEPQGGFSDSCLTLDDHGARPARRGVEELLYRGELEVASKDSLHATSFPT